MGLPGSSNLSEDILPMLIINIALSIGQIKHAFNSFMQVIGLLPASPTSSDTADYSEEYSLSSDLMVPGLSDEVLQALPRSVYNPDESLGDQRVEDKECSVCLQEFLKDQVMCILPSCRHVFHRGCLEQWLEHEQFTCPLCRSSLVPEEFLKRDQELSEELALWFSSIRGSGLQGLWCYS